MNQIKRTKPHVLLCYEALFRELKPKFRNNKTLQENYSNYLAGYRGEKYADYTISMYQQNSTLVYPGLRLTNGPFAFQIDSLIISEQVIFIIEIKNMKDELEYDSKTHQFIQKDGNKKKGYKSPILQAESQKANLQRWLQNNAMPPIPIETLVVVSNSSAIIINSQEDPSVFDKLIHLEVLPSKLAQLYSSYNKKYYDQNMLKLLNDKLLQGNTPLKVDLLTQLGINDNHLVKGIVCYNCDHFPLIREKRTWICPKCKKTNKKAHERKILDYFLLHNSTITNQQCRKLLQIDSARLSQLLLKSMSLKHTGENRGRKYLSPLLDEFPQDSFIPIKQKSIFHS
ncbi:Nuclease-related domain-containing protein [Oceanobacillus limi]|uniref:Nuclease-related domain-containing protein n=1 Tax=Oceanobacillus limi TaxID=930131 RepID=A0A1I0A097_9BACI|nr:nuclease-related domain-containing protein [Oceanobacillus limi]SES87353.1 Nuclease-related domain-containing protein [Oceanobacillus limi]